MANMTDDLSDSTDNDLIGGNAKIYELTSEFRKLQLHEASKFKMCVEDCASGSAHGFFCCWESGDLS